MSTGDSNSNNVHIFWISSLLNSLLPFTFLYRVDSLIFKYSATSDIVFPFSITAALNFNLLNNCFSSLLLRFRKLTITPFLRLRNTFLQFLFYFCVSVLHFRNTLHIISIHRLSIHGLSRVCLNEVIIYGNKRFIKSTSSRKEFNS